MVYLVALLLAVLPAHASQLDTFLGPADPAYYRAIAPRFIDWTSETFGRPDPRRSAFIGLMKKECQDLEAWSFRPGGEIQWPRLQFGLRFQGGREGDALLSVFPVEPEEAFKRLKPLLGFGIAPEIARNFIGFGVSLQSPDIVIYSSTEGRTFGTGRSFVPLKNDFLIRKSLFRRGRLVSDRFLTLLAGPPKQALPFTAFVETWRAWLKEDGSLDEYEVSLRKFNLRILDGAALRRARQINSEFILANLRLHYRAQDDYEILYP